MPVILTRRNSLSPILRTGDNSHCLRGKRFRRAFYSTGSKLFSVFERAKIGASAKKYPTPVISVALAAIFAPPKSAKCLEREEKPTETLATQTITRAFK